MRLLRVERDKRLAKDDWKVVKAKETDQIFLLLLRPIARHLETSSTATPSLDSNYELDMTSVTWPTEPS